MLLSDGTHGGGGGVETGRLIYLITKDSLEMFYLTMQSLTESPFEMV